MRSSRTSRLVADVSSSINSTRAPDSRASTIAAAWLVEPDASSVDRGRVDRPPGSSPRKAETSTFAMRRPSSARIFTVSGSATTPSRPSPGT